MSNLYGQNFNSSPARADALSQYLEMLLEEKKNLAIFVQGFPISNKLLNQEILRVSEMIPNQEFDRLHLGSSSFLNLLDIMPDGSAMRLGPLDGNPGCSSFPQLAFGGQQGSASPSSLITKKFLRLDVPVERFPNFNFVGRLLGPRGNSLKRIEACTGCRIFIRGRGSMKDAEKEERLRGRPGFWHLNDHLHVLIEAESTENTVDAHLRQAQDIIKTLLKPVNKSRDFYKRQQFRELAMLNSLFKGDTSRPSRSGAMSRTTTAAKHTTP